MAAGPYTETFIRTAAAGATVTYTVPAGRRAVVTCIAACMAAPGTSELHVMAAGIYLALHGFQAYAESRLWQLRAALYTGDQLAVHITAAGLQCTVAGYLLTDATGARYTDHDLEYAKVALLPGSASAELAA